jgi:hypothetical protein
MQPNSTAQNSQKDGYIVSEPSAEKWSGSNLQLIKQHVCHFNSERISWVHLLYDVNELLHR